MITASAVGFTIPGTPQHVGQARHRLAGFLTEAGAASAVVDDVLVAGSELITNAVLHSASGLPGGLVTIHAEIDTDGWAQVDVCDQGPIPPGATLSPFQIQAASGREGGLGLDVAAGLSSDLREFTGAGGDHITWFRIPLARPADKRPELAEANSTREVAR